jgi:hypothetical protein
VANPCENGPDGPEVDTQAGLSYEWHRDIERRKAEERRRLPVTVELDADDEDALRFALLLLRRKLDDSDCARVEMALAGPIGKVTEARGRQPAYRALLDEQRDRLGLGPRERE